MDEVVVDPLPLERLAGILSPPRAAQLVSAAERAGRAFGDRVVWHVSSTAQGGGVAEMLHTLLAYANGAGITNRWLVLDADPDFFVVTKRLHNLLHGFPGDGGVLSSAERDRYLSLIEDRLPTLLASVSPQDIVVLHDPQTAGFAEGLRDLGARVVWRCHVGRDAPNALTEIGWEFLRPFLQHPDVSVFSRASYAPAWMDPSRVVVIPPSIDPFAAKNVSLDPAEVSSILGAAGLLSGEGANQPGRYRRGDGTPASVRPRGTGSLLYDGRPPPADAPLVVQVSRWDRLKDMAGVMDGFTRAVADEHGDGAHLVLAGPEVSGVSDDPEGAAVLTECREHWAALSDGLRARVHLASIPMDDPEENAVIVNALQRHARVVVQKSLVEGFGLTVTEAMWKERAVVASRVGGIQDQIRDGVDGLLVDDPGDLDAFAAVLRRALGDASLTSRLGRAARDRVQDQFLGDRHLSQWVDLLASLVAGTGQR